MQTWNKDGQASLFARDGCAGRTCPACSAAERPRGRTSASSWRRSSELKTVPFMSLDLTPGHGNLLGESYWEMLSPWPGGSSTLNTGPAPLSGEGVCSLSQILQANPPRKYYLSRTACLGILRRARERGKELPPQLKAALMAQAGLAPAAALMSECTAGAERQILPSKGGGRHGSARPLFAAGFCAGAGPTAGSIGWQEECSPTLKASPSGNMMPSVLCLNGQGGSVMDCSKDVAGTLRAQHGGPARAQRSGSRGESRSSEMSELPPQGGSEGYGACDADGHQPVVIDLQGELPDVELYENHGIGSRYTGPHPVSPTLPARAGTGGNNLPLTLHLPDPGNAIDRQPQNGGNGIGYQAGIAYTLTATDHHAVFSRRRVDVFKHNNVASTESARQHKDATDLVLQETEDERPLLVRRLTPLECERLQGYPDSFTALPGASDSARYRALGNSVCIPCVEYIMRGIAWAVVQCG